MVYASSTLAQDQNPSSHLINIRVPVRGPAFSNYQNMQFQRGRRFVPARTRSGAALWQLARAGLVGQGVLTPGYRQRARAVSSNLALRRVVANRIRRRAMARARATRMLPYRELYGGRYRRLGYPRGRRT